MSTFKKGAIATVTAAALTAAVVTPASAEDKLESYSTSYKDNICTVETTYPDGEKSTTTMTSESAKQDLSEIIRLTNGYQKLLKEYEDRLTKEEKEKASPAKLAETREKIDSYRVIVKQYGKYRVVYQACAEGKSLSKTDVDAQALLSSPTGDGLSPAGIGVVVAGVVVVVLGAIVAALPMLKPMLPPQIAALLP